MGKSGHVFEADGSTVIEGAVVGAKNLRTGKYIPAASLDTTNSLGEYTIDLANFTDDYLNGDLVQIIAYKPEKYAQHNTVIRTVDGAETVNLTIRQIYYTTPASVAGVLRLGGFTMSTIPDVVEICNKIADAEDSISQRTRHSWKVETVTDEVHSLHATEHHIDNGTPIHLQHRKIREFDTDEGDKLEIWDGSNDVDWITDKTEGRANDFWVDYINGIVWVRTLFMVTRREDDMKVTYRFGETSVPKDIEKVTNFIVAKEIVYSEDWSVALPAGEGSNMDYAGKVRAWTKEINDILSRRSEIVTTDI